MIRKVIKGRRDPFEIAYTTDIQGGPKQLHYDMLDALTELEVDKDTKVLVITGAGPSWCAGQDLREYFRAPIIIRWKGAKRVGRRRSGAGGGCLLFRSRPSRWSTVSASAARSRR